MKKKLITLSALFLIILVGVAGRILIVEDDPEGTDICLAMSGHRDKRLPALIDIAKRGLCDTILMTGGKEGKSVSGAVSKIPYLLENGIERSSIMVDEVDIFSSFAEIQRLKVTVDKLHLEHPTVNIITSAYHTRRVKLISNWIFGNSVDVAVIPVLTKSRNQKWLWWWNGRDRSDVAREHIKIVYYLLRYKLQIPFFSSWLSRFEKMND